MGLLSRSALRRTWCQRNRVSGSEKIIGVFLQSSNMSYIRYKKNIFIVFQLLMVCFS